ncbi:hypothetical protein ADS78_13050, partial [Idiomarina abyssalis]
VQAEQRELGGTGEHDRGHHHGEHDLDVLRGHQGAEGETDRRADQRADRQHPDHLEHHRPGPGDAEHEHADRDQHHT